jgi:hypothetical protein
MGIVICRHLKGSAEGALCMVVNKFIKNMNGFSIKVCMSRHYEACPLYFSALFSLRPLSFNENVT